MAAADKRRAQVEAALRALSSETDRRREEGGGTGAGAGLAELVAAMGGGAALEPSADGAFDLDAAAPSGEADSRYDWEHDARDGTVTVSVSVPTATRAADVECDVRSTRVRLAVRTLAADARGAIVLDGAPHGKLDPEGCGWSLEPERGGERALVLALRCAPEAAGGLPAHARWPSLMRAPPPAVAPPVVRGRQLASQAETESQLADAMRRLQECQASLRSAPAPGRRAAAAAPAAAADGAGGSQDVLLLGGVLAAMLAVSGLWAWLCVFVWKLDGDPNRPPPGARASHGEQL